MEIWIDADACPVVVKEMIYRASSRLGVPVILVANRPLATPPSPLVRSISVGQGFDVADDYIADHVAPGDLVITADIPLADRALKRGAVALNPRGEVYTEANIAERLSVRNFLDDMRASGQVSGGPATFGNADKHRFAASLDRLLAGKKL